MATGPVTLKMSRTIPSGLADVPDSSVVKKVRSLARDAKVRVEGCVSGIDGASVAATTCSAVAFATVFGFGSAVACASVAGVGGLAVGVLPALFTFGLSIPVTGALGTGFGLVLGGAVGTTLGAAGGGAAGYVAYSKRANIKSLYSSVADTFLKTFENGKSWARDLQSGLTDTLANVVGATSSAMSNYIDVVRAKALVAWGGIQESTSTAKKNAVDMVSNPAVQVSAVSAAGGAVTAGACGAGSGFCLGGTIGAAVGVVPAVFTFGISIPVCAVIGSGVGTVAGAVVGGTSGLFVGGAAGYGAYSRRDTISARVGTAMTKADGAARYMKRTASDSAVYGWSKIVGGTGGTA